MRSEASFSQARLAQRTWDLRMLASCINIIRIPRGCGSFAFLGASSTKSPQFQLQILAIYLYADTSQRSAHSPTVAMRLPLLTMAIYLFAGMVAGASTACVPAGWRAPPPPCPQWTPMTRLFPRNATCAL